MTAEERTEFSVNDALDAIWREPKNRQEVSARAFSELDESDKALLKEVHDRWVARPALGAPAPTDEPPFNGITLLAALQIARNHSDSLLYWPAAQRDEAMSDFARSVDMPRDKFNILCGSWPAIQELIDHWRR